MDTSNGGRRSDLTQAVKSTPTPSATDYKGSSRGGQRKGQLTDPDIGIIESGGQLNPHWVEWLMNWPVGWTSPDPLPQENWIAWLQTSKIELTDSKPSEMDKFRQRLDSHGER